MKDPDARGRWLGQDGRPGSFRQTEVPQWQRFYLKTAVQRTRAAWSSGTTRANPSTRRSGATWSARSASGASDLPGSNSIRRRASGCHDEAGFAGGFLDERRAYRLMASVIEDHEAKLRLVEPSRPEALFPEAVEAWLVYLKTEKRVKPSTLAGYQRLLAQPSRDPRRGRIMREFGKRGLLDIKTKDARRFLAKLDREDISARTVNIHRQVLHAIFEFVRREDSFGLPSNPFADTAKRPEDGGSRSRPLSQRRSLPSRRLLEAALIVGAMATRTRTIRRRRSASGLASTNRMRPSS
jgi:integrase family protein with SAM-like domain